MKREWMAQAVILGISFIAAVGVLALNGFAAPAGVGRGPSALVADKGHFRIMADGKEAGQEDFEISAAGGNWIVQGKSTIQTEKGPTHVSGALELAANGNPVRYQWSTDGEKKASATITFSGAAASIALNLANTQPYTQQLTFSSEPVAILDNNLYDQYAVLAGIYDWSKKGAQTFSVLVPQELTPGSVTVESLGRQDLDGKQMDELSVKTSDLQINLFLDKGHLMRITAPQSGVEIVRD
ncbi:MAG TPA: hypothetical protein VNU84_02185 [Candidatus Acidoferrum sp.]|jgi:hypothetical protein|nr:hypothetical protein [Candidatus Acidoferrum sp.]